MYKIGNIWRWAGCAAVLAGALLYAQGRDLYGLHLDYLASEDEVRMLEVELAQSLKAEEGLRRRVNHLEGDPLELEAAIRETKRLVRQGETVYRVRLPERARNQEAIAVP